MIGRKRTYEEACEDHKQTEPQPVTSNPIQEQTFSKQLLQIYYDRLFPYQDMFNWLSYFNDPENKNPAIDRKIWRNREWSFTLKDDIYVRYKSYKNLKEFKQDLRKKCPYKIDIGALYNIEPCRRRTIASDKLIAEEKELVFDIDISDYDDVRTCCSEAGICAQCWPLMTCAIEVLDTVLRKDFGLKHLLFVFSGRRGIHCWCGDDIVRKFDVHKRSAMIDYLKLYAGNSMNKYKVDLQIDKTRDIHDSLKRAYIICEKYFISCSLEKQQVLDTEQGIDYFCDMIRFPNIKMDVKRNLLQLMDATDSVQKWETVKEIFVKYRKKAKENKRAIKANLYELVFSYVYPRLDVEVSRHVNHLLKSPFCIHPKTGKICSIIDPSTCDDFDPVNQPTLLQLVNEYNKAGKENGGNSNIGWRDTSLKDIIQVFRDTFLDDLQKEKAKIFKMQQKRDMEF